MEGTSENTTTTETHKAGNGYDAGLIAQMTIYEKHKVGLSYLHYSTDTYESVSNTGNITTNTTLAQGAATFYGIFPVSEKTELLATLTQFFIPSTSTATINLINGAFGIRATF
jgi:hypothetical protein